MTERFLKIMLKIAILDLYPERSYRVSKDTCGGFGTGNDFGDNLTCLGLKYFTRKWISWPPLYAIYTLSVLLKDGHRVTYLKNIPKNKSEFDLFILTTSIVAHETEIAAIKKLKAYNVLCIGSFASTWPEPYIEAGAKVLKGEAEFYFLNNKVSLSWFNSISSITTFAHESYLDELPFPAWEQLPAENLPRNGFFIGRKSLTIQASRGCPYSCRFYCTYPLQQGQSIRLRKPDNIVKEMLYFKKKLGVDTFVFRDPVFSLNRTHTEMFCREILKSRKKFRFTIETHLKNLDFDLLELLKKAGLEMIFFGIESANKAGLKNIHRHDVEPEKQKKLIRKIHALGIKTKASYILGSPSDTQEDCFGSIQLAKELQTSFAQFCVFTPYPGTPIYQELESQLTANRMEDFNQWQLVYKNNQISAADIRFLLTRAYTEFYSLSKLKSLLLSEVRSFRANWHNRQ